MNIKSKNFILLPRHLRHYNGCLVKLFDGRRGKIAYPYMIVTDDKTKLAVMIESKENFNKIYQIISKRDKANKNKVLAQRKRGSRELRVL